MTAATTGFGCKLKRGDGGGSEVFTDIAEVQSIEGPGLKVDLADVTNMDSPGGWKERIPTLKDGGEVTMDLNFLPASTQQGYTSGLLADLNNKTKRNFRLVFSNSGATTWDFSAFVTSFMPSAPVGERLSAKVTLSITGAPTLA